MCGIIGLFAKTPKVMDSLGLQLAAMLSQMGERGPDSAGVALYSEPTLSPKSGVGARKLTVQHDNQERLGTLVSAAKEKFSGCLTHTHGSHCVIEALASSSELENWVRENFVDVRVMSVGEGIQIFKEKGHPAEFAQRYQLQNFSGTHAVAHTRMATESAITTSHSHPFSTGLDLCLVHNGSLSNHNRLREQLQKAGINFETDNDSEVAAGFLTWRLRQGDTLQQALRAALRELDGFYTFAIGTRNGFAVLRDPIACKPAVLAETEDWVAMSSEYRAIAQLPGADKARVWEPEPAKIYTWEGEHKTGAAA